MRLILKREIDANDHTVDKFGRNMKTFNIYFKGESIKSIHCENSDFATIGGIYTCELDILLELKKNRLLQYIENQEDSIKLFYNDTYSEAIDPYFSVL